MLHATATTTARALGRRHGLNVNHHQLQMLTAMPHLLQSVRTKKTSTKSAVGSVSGAI